MSRQAVVFGCLATAALVGAFAWGVFDDVAPSENRQPPSATRESAQPAPEADTVEAPASVSSMPVRPRPVTAPVQSDAETAAPDTATLRIDSDVPGAQVFLDNKYVGTVPATAMEVPPGQRKINVQAPGYDGVAEFMNITPGSRDIMISLKTIRLDQRVQVEHKHRLGSCSGTLIATPEGVRYETSHTEDSFMVRLQDIDTFSADFLKKTLKLKIRAGRTYEFTDPSGKADAIYLFHQEVDKVRQRVK